MELVDVRFGKTETLSLSLDVSSYQNISRLYFDIAVLGKRREMVSKILQSYYIEPTPYSRSIPLLFFNLIEILPQHIFFNLSPKYLREFFSHPPYQREIFKHWNITKIELFYHYREPTGTLILTSSISESLQQLGAPEFVTFQFDQRVFDQAYLPNRIYYLLENIVPKDKNHAGELLNDIIKIINLRYYNQGEQIIRRRLIVAYEFLEALVISSDLRENAQNIGLEFQALSWQTVKLLDFDLSEIGPIIEFDLNFNTLLNIKSDIGFRNFESVSKKSIKQILDCKNLGRTIEAREAKTYMMTGSRKTAYNEPLEMPLSNVKHSEAEFYERLYW